MNKLDEQDYYDDQEHIYELPYEPDYNQLHLEAMIINLRLKTRRTLSEWILVYKEIERSKSR